MLDAAVMLFVLSVHPGHGAPASPLMHYLTELPHALPLAAAFGLGALAMTVIRRRGRARR